MTKEDAIKELELLHVTTAAPAGSVAGESCRAVNDALDMAIKALREPPRVRAHWGRYRDIIQCSNCGFGMFPIAYVLIKETAWEPMLFLEIAQNAMQ